MKPAATITTSSISRKNKFSAVIADVSGHGVGSALLMASVRAALRALVRHEPSGRNLVARLNDLIHDDVQDGRFITFFLGRFDSVQPGLRARRRGAHAAGVLPRRGITRRA